ncbi:hypothetical protein O7598_00810 [Micromonospora sp. WMMC241]|uniref:hypothetical protein n=1 Tax=Micromonospora sp. WMMC241 TaxID=3015159 RepID=UPI0022B6C46E|nr:hypothetical protein [Micromonospora sp. WMMC241]MCZ7434922.1 hypothetical protein [Micromonospora sp. WMMC241]
MWAGEVERAGERLYAVFARHPMPSDMAACEHCVDPADVDRFRRTPLRALNPEQLGGYLGNSGTWGDGSELPHLVPRLLTAYAGGEMTDWWWPATVTRRIGEQWAVWTPAERDAVEGFLRAWWRWTLTSWPSTCPAEEVLDAVAALELSVDPYLADFAELPGEAPIRHLAEIVRWSAPNERSGRELARWLASDVPAELLWTAAVAGAGTPLGDELVEAADLVDLLRSTR